MKNLSRKDYYQLPKTTYMLVTTDKYELPVSVCDTLKEMSNETGIPFTQLYQSYYRNETCAGGRYRVHKIDISEKEFNPFNAEDYAIWCELHNLRTCEFDNLKKYRRICNIFFHR